MSDCGHGHVHPRADGVKARCGGPALCSRCAADAAVVRSARDVLLICVTCHGRYWAESLAAARSRSCLCGGELKAL